MKLAAAATFFSSCIPREKIHAFRRRAHPQTLVFPGIPPILLRAHNGARAAAWLDFVR
jgi:hypothetical protein